MATTTVYGNATKAAFNKEIDWNTDTIKLALLTSSYTPDQDAHDYFNDVSAFEASGTGYSSGGATMANCVATYTSGTNKLKLDADNTTFSTVTITARYGVVYVSTGTPATSALICYIDFGSDVSATAGDLVFTWHADGIVEYTVA